MDSTSHAIYRQVLRTRLVAYRRQHFAARRALFEAGPHGSLVFTPGAAHLNLFDPALYHALTRRPRTIRRMDSARALAISVFGTLARREDLALLAQVACDDGAPILSAAEAQSATLDLQRPLDYLADPHPPGIDVWLSGDGLHLAVAPRLLERGLAGCPQPRRGRCSGDYLPSGCHYTARGAAYWQLLPGLTGWSAAQPHRPCPMAGTFALARALLAAADPRAPGPPSRRGALLVYDARNPAFRPGSRADRLYGELQHTLPPHTLLRRATWQALAAAMARSDWYADLLAYLRVKYGIEA